MKTAWQTVIYMASDKDKTGIYESIENVRKQTDAEANLSPALKAAIDSLVNICLLLAGKQLPKNSKNSSILPSADPNREKKPAEKTGRKPGGQYGHKGARLEPVENPDRVVTLKVDRKKLPPGNRKAAGYEKRQVFEIETHGKVIEYQAEILKNDTGEKITAGFPDGLVQAAQYGRSVKTQAVYMSVYQLVPCDRASEHFEHQWGVPLSPGSVCNFKEEACAALERYENRVKERLIHEKVLNLDETGINAGGKRVWLHNASSELYTLYMPHEKRGKEAMDAMGIIADTEAVLVHDHWKPYYSYADKRHALCNSHHIRELAAAGEEGQKRAQPMIDLLLEIDKSTTAAGGALSGEEQKRVRKRYRRLLDEAGSECPPPPERPGGRRGIVKKTKSRNLLERMRDFADDTLRFMTDKSVPFTNNLAERDLRMNKARQKISGCFRSREGAKIFGRVRGFLSTCAKHDVSATDALTLLFDGKLPDFVRPGE